MLRIDIQIEKKQKVMRLEGRLSGEGVTALEQVWSEHISQPNPRPVELVLERVEFIDLKGRSLLEKLHKAGVKIKAQGCLNREILKSIEIHQHKQEGKAAGKILPSMSLVFAVVSFCLLVLYALPAFAVEPLQLGMKSAVALALKQNPQAQIAAISIAESQAQSGLARAGLLPKVGVEMFDEALRYNREAYFDMQISMIPKVAGPYQFLQMGAGFEAPVFDLTLWRRWQASKAAQEATRNQSAAVREKITVLVVSQYLGCLRADAAVQAAKSRLELATSLYERAQSLQQSGVGTSLDTLRAEVQMKAERQKLVSLEAQRQVALYGLARILDTPQGQGLELTDQLNFFEMPAIAIDQVLSQAWTSRPEMKAMDAKNLALILKKKGASESRLPSIVASGQWGYQGISLDSSIPSYQYRVTLKMPLLTGGQIRAERALADLDMQKVSQERQELRAAITLEVNTAVEILKSARQEVEMAADSLKLAEEEIRQARDRFEAGIAPNIEVTSAQDNLARAQDAHLGALYRYNQARADLAYACGQVENTYLN